MRIYNTMIVSDNQRLQPVTNNKVCLLDFDNKRYLLPNVIKTLFGHYEIAEWAIDEIDWIKDNDPFVNFEVEEVSESE